MKQIYIGYNKFNQSPHHPSFFQSHRSPWRNVCNRATKKAVHLYDCIRNAEFILVQIFNSSKGLSFELKNLWDLRKIFVLSKNNNKDLDGLGKKPLCPVDIWQTHTKIRNSIIVNKFIYKFLNWDNFRHSKDHGPEFDLTFTFITLSTNISIPSIPLKILINYVRDTVC